MLGQHTGTTGRAVGALLTLVIASQACAQSEDFFDLSPEHLGRLRVTAASAFTESVLDASAAVSVVSRDDWSRRGARTIPDALLHLPGVMQLYPPAGGPLIQVRSYDSTSLRGRATLVDGVPINTFAFGSEVFSNAELQVAALDSIELVRGPSSILYGSDAFHSALVLSTYRNEVSSLEVTGAAGSSDFQRIAVRGSHVVGDGAMVDVAIAAAHQGDQSTDYSYPANGGWANVSRSQRYDAGTGLVRWRGREAGLGYSLQLFVDKTEAEEFPGGGTFAGDVGPYDVADRNAELWLLKGALDGQLGDDWAWQWSAYGWRNDYGQSYVLPAAPTLFFEDRQQFVERRFGSHLQVKRPELVMGSTVTQLAITAGAERAVIDDHDNERIALSQFMAGRPPADYEGLDQSILSMAVEGKTHWSDGRWQAIYGGRVDHYSTFGSELSPRLGIIWMPATDYSLRAVYGTAFRAPNANELRGTNFVSGNSALDPETIENVEIAFTYARNRWQWEVVGFSSRWEDRILLVQNPSAVLGRRYTNVGSSEAQGLESSLTWRGDRWRLELSGSYIRNRNRETDEEPSVMPDWIANIGVGYRWPAHDIELFWANRLHEDVKVGDTALASRPLDDAGLFYRSDLSLTQDWSPNWQGRLVVRNLFDRNNVWPSITNSHGGVADIERQVVLEITYRGLF